MGSPGSLDAGCGMKGRESMYGCPLSFARCQMLGVVTLTETARATQGRVFLCSKKWICLVLAGGQRHSSQPQVQPVTGRTCLAGS